ncbi:MAG: hypothetical protein DYH13_08035 [Alphaproteobacteria bacterium PRO2]|nr:hypothetical protein [Alphaproteobacteria bacterium PRO2]
MASVVDQFYRMKDANGNNQFYHRMNDRDGNSKHVFVQVDIRTNADHTELFHKSNNLIRLSEALWFPEGQVPSEPYDARSSKIVDMVMNRDLGLKELVDLKSKIDTMLEQGYKPSAYDLRALKSFMEGAQYNVALDGGDPRLALVTLSINSALLGRDQVWAHRGTDGKYIGGKKFENALNEFLKDEDAFWRKLHAAPGAPQDLPDLKTPVKSEPELLIDEPEFKKRFYYHEIPNIWRYEEPEHRKLPIDPDEWITKYLREHPFKTEPMIYRYEPERDPLDPKEFKINPEIFRIEEAAPLRKFEYSKGDSSPDIAYAQQCMNDLKKLAGDELQGVDLGNYGLNKDGVDAKLGDKTHDSVIAIEKYLGIDPPTGKITDELVAKMKFKSFELNLSEYTRSHPLKPDREKYPVIGGIQDPDMALPPSSLPINDPKMIIQPDEFRKLLERTDVQFIGIRGSVPGIKEMLANAGAPVEQASVQNGPFVTADSKVAPAVDAPLPPAQKNTHTV